MTTSSYQPRRVVKYEVVETTWTSYGLERRVQIEFEDGTSDLRWLRHYAYDTLVDTDVIWMHI